MKIGGFEVKMSAEKVKASCANPPCNGWCYSRCRIAQWFKLKRSLPPVTVCWTCGGPLRSRRKPRPGFKVDMECTTHPNHNIRER